MSRIRQKPFDPTKLKLSPEEGFVLSRIDGQTTAKDLVALTGLPDDRVAEIVAKLTAEDVIELEGAPPAPSRAPEADQEPPAEPELQPELDPTEEQTEDSKALEQTARAIYEREYRAMARDARIEAASKVSGANLTALCLDPEPQVIHAILTNPHATLDHVRAIAQHHRTQNGLEAIAKRADHLSDRQVQRQLLRNPQLPTTLLNRIASSRMLADVYKLAIDREIPERSRGLTKDILRKKFTMSSADEKAAFLFKTEGRCLLHLTNCSLDAHATQILCSKNAYTLLFVQNLARWSATPPSVLAHLLKQPVVRHNQGIKKMLLKHPNMPSEAKRQNQ